MVGMICVALSFVLMVLVGLWGWKHPLDPAKEAAELEEAAARAEEHEAAKKAKRAARKGN